MVYEDSVEEAMLSRRGFLKLTGAAGAVAIPTLLGYELVRGSQGQLPPSLSPYAQVECLRQWPSSPAQAAPILLLVGDQGTQTFGLYANEILHAEGLSCVHMAYLSELDSAPLSWYDLVLLAAEPLSLSQADMLENYVVSGGNLVALRPDARLIPLFGVERAAGNTSDGYLQVEAGHPITAGIATDSLQFHGTADHYYLEGAQAIAWLSSEANVASDLPAVTLHRFGQGQAILWAFDLAKSIALTRQGNPAWANQERDGGDGIRAPDMFKDWVDLDRLAIPQADQQQRLLINLLAALSQGKRPLPRLWYFPGAAETMLIATGDSHGNPGYAIEDVLGRVEKRSGHFTVYYTSFPSSAYRRAIKKGALWATELPVVGDTLDEQFTSPSPSEVADWRARGHEFALHPYVEEGLDLGWARFWQEFTGMGYGPVPPTARTHRILWTGWAETARAQAARGIRMNLDYYHWGPAFQTDGGEWVNGHFTGSGLPMRFVDEHGRILNIYQQPTQIADDHLLNLHWGGVAKLSAKAAIEVSQGLLQQSLDGDYCAIAGNFHVDPFAVGGEWIEEAVQWLDGTLDYAAENDIPIWSAQDWLQFTEVRHASRLENVQWHADQKRLSFDLSAEPVSEVALAVMVPQRHGQLELTMVEIDGAKHTHGQRAISGLNYGWVSVPAGPHRVVALYG
jgi:hypothetical protein